MHRERSSAINEVKSHNFKVHMITIPALAELTKGISYSWSPPTSFNYYDGGLKWTKMIDLTEKSSELKLAGSTGDMLELEQNHPLYVPIGEVSSISLTTFEYSTTGVDVNTIYGWHHPTTTFRYFLSNGNQKVRGVEPNPSSSKLEKGQITSININNNKYKNTGQDETPRTGEPGDPGEQGGGDNIYYKQRYLKYKEKYNELKRYN